MTWSWKTGVIPFTAKCSRCEKPLRYESNIVSYRGFDYHVACVLDELTDKPKEESVGHWGMLDPHLYP